MSQILFVEIDTKPNLTCAFENTDVSTYTSIVLSVKRPDGTVISRNAVIDDGPGGLFHFAWQAGDLQYGISLAEIRFTDAGGGVLTIPNDNPMKLISRKRLA